MPVLLADEVVPGAMESITGGMSTITTIVGDVFTLMTSNPLLCVFLAASLVGVGIAIFRKIKGAAR